MDNTVSDNLKKIKKYASVLICAALIGILAVCFSVQPVFAASDKVQTLGGSVEAVSSTSIKVSWAAQKSVVRWEIQIGYLKHPKTLSTPEMKGQFHTIATLNKNKTKYTVKGLEKKRYYYFRVLGYTKKDGKLVLTYKTKDTRMLGRTVVRLWLGVNPRVETAGLTSLKLSWKSHRNVVKWKVQLRNLEQPKTDSVTAKGDFYTVAVLKKGSTHYTIRGLDKDSYYYIRLLGYTRENGKLVLKYKTYSQQIEGRTGIREPYWSYEEYWDYDFSPSKILLRISMFSDFNEHDMTASHGLMPDGFEFYRKARNAAKSKYRIIATVPVSGGGAEYEDRTVTAGKKYSYRVRAYKTMKGRKKYSLWSSCENISAINQYGTFRLKKIATSEDEKTMVVKLTSSDQYNADLTINGRYEASNFILENNDNGRTSHSGSELKLTGYSKDGTHWTEYPSSGTSEKEILLQGNQSIYLRLETAADASQTALEGTDLYIGGLTYDNTASSLEIPLGGTGKADVGDWT